MLPFFKILLLSFTDNGLQTIKLGRYFKKVKVDENRLTITRQGINDIYKYSVIIYAT